MNVKEKFYTKRLNVKVSSAHLKIIKKFAKERGISKSEWVRQWLLLYGMIDDKRLVKQLPVMSQHVKDSKQEMEDLDKITKEAIKIAVRMVERSSKFVDKAIRLIEEEEKKKMKIILKDTKEIDWHNKDLWRMGELNKEMKKLRWKRRDRLNKLKKIENKEQFPDILDVV